VNDSSLLESQVQSVFRYKIQNIKYKKTTSVNGVLLPQIKIEIEGWSLLIEPIDELHSERKICKFTKSFGKDSAEPSEVIGYFIADALNDQVSHLAVEECKPGESL
jgi:hypothetical protein